MSFRVVFHFRRGCGGLPLLIGFSEGCLVRRRATMRSVFSEVENGSQIYVN